MTLAERVPWSVRAPVRRARNAFAQAVTAARQIPRWRAIAAAQPRRDAVAVSYGVERMPGREKVVVGGHVKFALLHEALPNAPRDFNVLYLGSSSLVPEAPLLVRLARRRGAAFVWNQNGVAYPGWYGEGYELVNRPRARLFRAADYVFFQSAFCKLSADTFYGPRDGPWEVLHNPVDTSRFVPARRRPRRPLTLLLGGSQYQRYPLEVALGALAIVRRERSDARLLVTGALSFAPAGDAQARQLVRQAALDAVVDFTGPYTQDQAPDLFHAADILLHPKVNDPCPTVVLEAMACGLPVVYSASGGTPELLAPAAGIGIPTPLDWQRDHAPPPELVARAVLEIAAELEERAAAARAQAEKFDARGWVDRHRAILSALVGVSR